MREVADSVVVVLSDRDEAQMPPAGRVTVLAGLPFVALSSMISAGCDTGDRAK